MARMCQYGNCVDDVVMSKGVSVNYHNEEKPQFCCAAHAALWLLRRDDHWRDRDKLMALIDKELFKRG